jgi:hypothetical protein
MSSSFVFYETPASEAGDGLAIGSVGDGSRTRPPKFIRGRLSEDGKERSSKRFA